MCNNKRKIEIMSMSVSYHQKLGWSILNDSSYVTPMTTMTTELTRSRCHAVGATVNELMYT